MLSFEDILYDSRFLIRAHRIRCGRVREILQMITAEGAEEPSPHVAPQSSTFHVDRIWQWSEY